MENFKFNGNSPIVAGVGAINQINDCLQSFVKDKTNVAVVTDLGVCSAGIADRVLEILSQRYNTVIFDNIKSDPDGKVIDKVAAFIRSKNVSCVVALGGGTVLDVVKLATAIADSGQKAENFFGATSVPKSQIAKILVPTTAGTGSEVTRTSIGSDVHGNIAWVWGENLKADFVILDPELILSLPVTITAATGLDALIHALEACSGKRRNYFYDSFAYQALRLGFDHLLMTIDSPQDLPARAAMLTASNLAGIAIDGCGTGVAHAIAHALKYFIDVPHGVAVAVGLKIALPWNIKGRSGVYNNIAKASGLTDAKELSKEFDKLIDRSGVLNFNMYEKIKISPELLAEKMWAPENTPMMKNNARNIDEKSTLVLAKQVTRFISENSPN